MRPASMATKLMPTMRARRRGRPEKELMAVQANQSILKKGYLVEPAARGSRSKGTMASLRPSQATMPRMKRCCSRKLRMA